MPWKVGTQTSMHNICADNSAATASLTYGRMNAPHVQHTVQYRRPLCSYFSPALNELLTEIQQAYVAAARVTLSGTQQRTAAAAAQTATHDGSKLLALIVPHGAACDGFHVAAHAYSRLATYLKQQKSSCLTAVLIGTEHRGSTPIAVSRRDWLTPLGAAPVNTAAVDYLAQTHAIPVNETPHDTEHSIENQLPFLMHAASWGWDLAAAGCAPTPASAAAARAGASSSSASPITPASLSIVPISIGYVGAQPGLIQQYGAAVADLLQHLSCPGHHRSKHQQQQQQQDEARAVGKGAGSDCHEVVLIVITDFTHAGPWYQELPPPGVALEDYMAAQDAPVLQAVQQGSVDKLLAAAAATRNSMCGLYPLAVALEAIYAGGSSSSSSSSKQLVPGRPELLAYTPAHLIFKRPDSTGFAALAVYSKSPG